MNNIKFSIIVAVNNDNGIGYKGDLLYRSKKDMEYFRKITTESEDNKINAVIMGKNTWYSIPSKYRPLKKRLNIIISKNNKLQIEEECIKYSDCIYVFDSLNNALNFLKNQIIVDKIFIIGGERLYQEALKDPLCEYLYITKIDDNTISDRKFPEINENNYKIIQNNEDIENEMKIVSQNIKKNIKLNFIKYQKL